MVVMIELRKVIGLGVAGALLATSAAPAMARSKHWGWGHPGYGHGHGRRYRDRDRISAGDVLAGILILGTVAAVASAASKAKDQDKRDDRYPDDRYPDDRDRSLPRDDDRGRDERRDDDRAEIGDEDAAVQACAVAAEQRAEDDGDIANVREISAVDATGDGYEVSGIVESRDSYRERFGESRRFRCTVRFGTVEDLRIEDALALR